MRERKKEERRKISRIEWKKLWRYSGRRDQWRRGIIIALKCQNARAWSWAHTGRRQGHIRIVVRTRDPLPRTRVNPPMQHARSAVLPRIILLSLPPPLPPSLSLTRNTFTKSTPVWKKEASLRRERTSKKIIFILVEICTIKNKRSIFKSKWVVNRCKVKGIGEQRVWAEREVEVASRGAEEIGVGWPIGCVMCGGG